MTIASNLHTHSTWCDGQNTPREMALAAAGLGFTDLGFSSHSPTPLDRTCPGIQNEAAYREEISRLKEEFAGKLGILCGVEEDLRAPVRREDYDYVITSNHYLPPRDGRLLSVDSSFEQLRGAIDADYGGDAQAMLRDYFEDVLQSVKLRSPDVVGHFDLVKKFNKNGSLFDEQGSAYRNMALGALDAVIDILLARGGVLEVNTGAWARGLRDEPYPGPVLLCHAAQRGAPVILSSDCHCADMLNAKFDEALALLRAVGFKRVMALKAGVFVPVEIG